MPSLAQEESHSIYKNVLWGKKETWRHRTVENILSKEKYKGDDRLQKCYTVDFLSKKRKANEGEVPQYYVEGSHDAIIEPAEWQLV